MAWLVLILSGVLEAGWATALHKSDGFRPLPSLAFAVAAPATLVGPAQAMRALPVPTAYAGRVGIGVPDGRVRDVVRCRTHQPLRVLLLVGVVACVIGLKLTHEEPVHRRVRSPLASNVRRPHRDVDARWSTEVIHAASRAHRDERDWRHEWTSPEVAKCSSRGRRIRFHLRRRRSGAPGTTSRSSGG